ncbi:hypothetical protein ACFLZB_02230 [Nanoarchaeota archaeon]
MKENQLRYEVILPPTEEKEHEEVSMPLELGKWHKVPLGDVPGYLNGVVLDPQKNTQVELRCDCSDYLVRAKYEEGIDDPIFNENFGNGRYVEGKLRFTTGHLMIDQSFREFAEKIEKRGLFPDNESESFLDALYFEVYKPLSHLNSEAVSAGMRATLIKKHLEQKCSPSFGTREVSGKAYFPEKGELDDHSWTEVGVIGSEGKSGWAVLDPFCGSFLVPKTTYIMKSRLPEIPVEKLEMKVEKVEK